MAYEMEGYRPVIEHIHKSEDTQGACDRSALVAVPRGAD